MRVTRSLRCSGAAAIEALKAAGVSAEAVARLREDVEDALAEHAELSAALGQARRREEGEGQSAGPFGEEERESPLAPPHTSPPPCAVMGRRRGRRRL